MMTSWKLFRHEKPKKEGEYLIEREDDEGLNSYREVAEWKNVKVNERVYSKEFNQSVTLSIPTEEWTFGDDFSVSRWIEIPE